MRNERSVATSNHHFKFDPQQEKNVVLPNIALFAPKTAGITLFVGVLITTENCPYQLKL